MKVQIIFVWFMMHEYNIAVFGPWDFKSSLVETFWGL